MVNNMEFVARGQFYEVFIDGKKKRFTQGVFSTNDQSEIDALKASPSFGKEFSEATPEKVEEMISKSRIKIHKRKNAE
jgi:hypothetical protein